VTAEKPAGVAVEICPIQDADLEEVARLLGRHFPPSMPPERWAVAWRRSVNRPGTDAPNHGVMLRAGGLAVGAYLAIYSTRVIDGVVHRFCNLAAWYMAPAYRHHSVRVAKALLGQDGWTFTDLAPVDAVQRLNRRLGFTYLDTTASLFPNIPWPTLPGRVQVSADPEVIRAHLADPILGYYDDHARARWARHLVLVRAGESCYVQWRKERRKNTNLIASIRHVSNPPLLRQGMRPLARYLLLHHGAVATSVEVRMAGGRVMPSVLMPKPTLRMYKSDVLGPEDIDYLYSEITIAP
jgi:hypothetical protein